eukprot:TRINITY_DN19633_c0_g1_i1.p1 TRINITY_DN19633_c0_g1~~TRINITY_DN19633_c0_g1_i1.p1  ORF type:complete len:552 (-),score=103.33 TRINITY_DN19633_c0_g1_i1:73-1668(-)
MCIRDRCSAVSSMLQVGCLTLARALRRSGFHTWREHVAAKMAETLRQGEQSNEQASTEAAQKQLEERVGVLTGWLEIQRMKAHRSHLHWTASRWMRTQLGWAMALWTCCSQHRRPIVQERVATELNRYLTAQIQSFYLRRRHVHLLRGFFCWKDHLYAKMLLEDLGSVETMKEQQGEILFEYIAMANRRRKYELNLLWGFSCWREVTMCETAWHHVNVLQTRFCKTELAGCFALWSAEASRRVTVRKMHQECETIAVQTHEIETRFSRVNRNKQSLQHQTLTAQAELLCSSQRNLKSAQRLVIMMLSWLGNAMLHWGMEAWVRGLASLRLRRAASRRVRSRASSVLQLAMERWSGQARRLAEQTSFQMQLFQTKSQLAGAYRGIENIQPLIADAETKARLQLGAQRTASLLLRQSAVGKGKSLAHWRERVAGRVLVSKLLTQVIDDPIVEHGLSHMFLSWQESADAGSAARGNRSTGVDVPQQEWMEGFSRMNSQNKPPPKPTEPKRNTKREEVLKKAAIRMGQWSSKHTS